MTEPGETRRHTTLSPLLRSLGPWQFRAEPGVAVGGGAFARVPLDLGEDVVSTTACSSRHGFLPLSYGFLTLTSSRLIYTPFRWPVSPFDGRGVGIALREIESLSVEPHFKPDFVPPRADALVVRTGRGRVRLFFVLNVAAWKKAVEEQQASAIAAT